MAGFILAEKSNSSQKFDEQGKRVPVTYLNTAPCYLIDIQTSERNGYSSVKLGFGKIKTVKKSVQGQVKKAGIETPLHFLREIRLNKHANNFTVIEENGKKGIQYGENKIFIGEVINPVLLFKIGDLVQVTGISKGKGFQGVVKRHGFHGGPKTHGQSDRWRAPGSIGQTTTPGRIYKGKRMAGRMGGDTVTVKNLKVVEVDEKGITISGLVPGHKEGLLVVTTVSL